MTTDTLIQVTIAVASCVAGIAIGSALQRQALAAATGQQRRWGWLTPSRVMSLGVVLIAVCGILTAVSVRSCQSAYNEEFGRSLDETRQATDLVFKSLADLSRGVLDPDPMVRRATVEEFNRRIDEALRLRQENRPPPQPQC